jgi:pimeloyl-ACP methyl ester carboxylesterase
MARKITAAVIGILLIVAVAPYLLGDVESEVLDTQTRKGVRGGFVAVEDGTIHYELNGPADAQTVVLIHGLGSWLFAWDPLVPLLADAGFQTLTYDVFGRGYSDRPRQDYSEDLLDRQLLHLLQALDVHSPVDLVGWSMGGAIAAIFAERHPDMVRRLALFAPAGVSREPPVLLRLVRLPSVGEWMMRLQPEEAMLANVTSQFYHEESGSLFVEPFVEQLRFKGYRRAILSTLRHYPLLGLGGTYDQIGGNGLPTLLIWGQDDIVTPVAGVENLRAAIPTVEVHVLDRAGHAVHFENPDRVGPILVEFLQAEAG